MKKNPKVSICIPTYNREFYLNECLNSIVRQLNKNNINKIEIIISDNASTDNTSVVVKSLLRKYSNIRYFRNNKNIGLEKNLLKVGTYAKGQYVWFMSDDDLQKKGAIDYLLDNIQNYDPSVVFLNLNAFNTKDNQILGKNLLGINEDYFFSNRKGLFKFLSWKFPYRIDWITTFYSILIIKRDILPLSISLAKRFNSKLDMFPHELGIFYSRKDFKFLILHQPVINYREGNSSWRQNNKLDFLKYWDKSLYNHYAQIISINVDSIPLEFKINFQFKNLIRKTRLIYEIILNELQKNE